MAVILTRATNDSITDETGKKPIFVFDCEGHIVNPSLDLTWFI